LRHEEGKDLLVMLDEVLVALLALDLLGIVALAIALIIAKSNTSAI